MLLGFGGSFGFAFGFSLGAGFGVFGPLLGEDLFKIFVAFFAGGEVLGDGDGALFGVFYDVFHGGGGVGLFFLAAEVAAGYLEAVEEEAGSFGVEVVGGEADQDLGDGGLDGASVFGVGESEGSSLIQLCMASLGVLFWDWAAKIVVVVAEVFTAERGRAAAMAAGQDVAALETLWCGACHVCGPPRAFWCKVFTTLRLGLDFGELRSVRMRISRAGAWA